MAKKKSNKKEKRNLKKEKRTQKRQVSTKTQKIKFTQQSGGLFSNAFPATVEEIIGRTEDVVIGKDGRHMVRFHGKSDAPTNPIPIALLINRIPIPISP